MRISAFALTLVLGASLAAAPVPKELKLRPDAERICGVWTYEFYMNGEAKGGGGRWYFTREKLYSGGTNTTDALGTEYGIVLRPELSPGQMDIAQNGNIVCSGIYKFEGEDLFIAYVHTGERPKDFNTAAGRSILKLKRASEAKK